MPNPPKPGDVLQVSIPTGLAYGRVYRDGIVCIYQHDAEAPNQPPVGSREFAFCLQIDDVALPWALVGDDPFASDDEAWPPPAQMIERHVPDRPARSLQSYLAESRDLAERLVRAPDDLSAYKTGIDLLQLGSRDVPESELATSIMAALTWIWGDLTDAVDAPDADPDTTESTQRMRRAAHEWLSVSEDPDARAHYLDRWQYDECGDRRPLVKPATSECNRLSPDTD